MAAVVDKLNLLIAPVVDAMGYEFVGCEYLPYGHRAIVRLYIDGEQGVSLDDCAKVSRQVSDMLDVEDLIEGRYSLEVSSPGIERPLFTEAQYRRYVGHGIKVRFHHLIKGRRQLIGTLQAVEDRQLVILSEQQAYTVALIDIAKANLVAEQNSTNNRGSGDE